MVPLSNGIKNINPNKIKTMKKFYLENGEQVKIGDVISKVPFNPNFVEFMEAMKSAIEITEENVDSLVKQGILKVVEEVVKEEEEPKEFEFPNQIKCYIKNMATKADCKFLEMEASLKMLWKVNKTAVFSAFLREVAIHLDKNYADHINQSANIYVISTLDGKIVKIPHPFVSYKNFAAFRTLEDAKRALYILKPLYEKLYK